MRTITAKQLIEQLQDLPSDAQIAVASDYGDRSHTQQVQFLRGDIEKTPISENCYSDSGYAVSRDEDGDDSSESVWILS